MKMNYIIFTKHELSMVYNQNGGKQQPHIKIKQNLKGEKVKKKIQRVLGQ